MGITSKSLWLLINILGGIAVIGSYILGFRSRADAFTVLWGGVPERIRVFYTVGMVLAALGYFAFGIYLLILAPGEISVFGRFGFGMLGLIFLLILLPSALWMPLTLLAVTRASRALAWLVRADLALVGAGSLALFLALWNLQAPRLGWLHLIAVMGSLAFCLQTVVLDAIIWSASFRV
jgi:hypothetical protein